MPSRRCQPASNRISARADSGFYCSEAVEAYEETQCGFVILARKTSRLVEQLEQAEWKPSPKTDADEHASSCISRKGGKKRTDLSRCAMPRTRSTNRRTRFSI